MNIYIYIYNINICLDDNDDNDDVAAAMTNKTRFANLLSEIRNVSRKQTHLRTQIITCSTGKLFRSSQNVNKQQQDTVFHYYTFHSRGNIIWYL